MNLKNVSEVFISEAFCAEENKNIKKSIYTILLDNNIPRDRNENIVLSAGFNPVYLTKYAKSQFEIKNNFICKLIKDAIEKNADVIHIKNSNEKNYEVSTPYDGEVQYEGIKNLIFEMHAIIGIIGSFPILYRDESNSAIRVVAPRRNSQNETSSQSPFNPLDWHVDAAYRPMGKSEIMSPLPDYLVFGVVHKGHHNLPIMYISLDELLSQLNAFDIAIGLLPEFAVSSPDSFANKIVSKNVPLLEKNSNGMFCSRITFQNAQPLTKRASDFLEKIKYIANQKNIQRSIYVEAGDIVVLNNKTTLHKRNSYQPKWDGKDRYFIRTYSVKDLNQGIIAKNAKNWEWL